MSSDGGHRKLTKDAARDLIGLFLVLALIIAGMLSFRKKLQDPQDEAKKDWYYERIAPPGAAEQRSR